MVEKKDGKTYSDFSNVRSLKNELIPEEFPDGAFGESIGENQPAEGKSTPWQEGQRRQSAFVYAYKALHQDLPRQTPGAHPIHDEPGNVYPEEEQ